MRVLARFNITDGRRDVESVEVVEYGPEDDGPLGLFVERRPLDERGEQGPATWAVAWSTAGLAMACALDLAGWEPKVLASEWETIVPPSLLLRNGWQEG